MSRRRQKGKGHKRRKNWHRGRGEAQLWDASQLPDVGSGAHPADASPPGVANRRPGKRWKGESA